MEETLLIKELQNNNQLAFKQLVEMFKNKVINTAYGFVQNKHNAQDVAQDVFIEIFNSINSFTGKSTLSTWIYRITVNKSLDYLRHQKRKKRWATLLNITDNSNDENTYQSSDNPLLNLEQAERIEILNSALKKLPESQRVAFTLHKYEDLNHAQIAQILNTTVPSVESLMHRAKQNLRKYLYNYYYKH